MNDPRYMTQVEVSRLFANILEKQRSLACNDNFYIKGFDKHLYMTMLQAFAEELNLIKVLEDENRQS